WLEPGEPVNWPVKWHVAEALGASVAPLSVPQLLLVTAGVAGADRVPLMLSVGAGGVTGSGWALVVVVGRLKGEAPPRSGGLLGSGLLTMVSEGATGVISMVASSKSETGVFSSSWPETVTVSVCERGAPVKETSKWQVVLAPTASVVPMSAGQVLLVTLAL